MSDREERKRGEKLLGEHDRLHSGNLKALAAPHIFAGHHVIATQHVGLGFGEAGAVSFVSPARQLILLGAHQPADFVLGGLLAMRTVQGRCLFLRPFIKKIALFHKVVGAKPTHSAKYYCTSLKDELWQDGSDGKKEEAEALHCGRSRKDHGPRTDRCAACVTSSSQSQKENRKAQAYAGEASQRAELSHQLNMAPTVWLVFIVTVQGLAVSGVQFADQPPNPPGVAVRVTLDPCGK
jgi:hypothetical protein